MLSILILNKYLYFCSSVSDPNDSHHWQLMSAIKSNILRRMDTAPSGVRICCIKFVQQVVLVQTPGMVDPRVNTVFSGSHAQYSHTLQRPDHSDISLALVPRDHPLIPYANLEAEGQGLLDRLLDIIHGDHRSDTLVSYNGTTLSPYQQYLLATEAGLGKTPAAPQPSHLAAAHAYPAAGLLDAEVLAKVTNFIHIRLD